MPGTEGSQVIDLGEISDVPSARSFESSDITKLRAHGATWVAKALVWIFGVTILLLLAGGFVLMVVNAPKNPAFSKPDDPKDVVVTWLIPFLREVASFASTVFAPILAFILGYYFSEKTKV